MTTTKKGDYRMRKIFLATAALGAAAAMPAAPAGAAQSAPLYCIPPASAQAAAQGETSATATVLAAYKTTALAALHSVSVTAGTPGPGRIAIVIAAKGAHHKQVEVAKGSASVTAAGCGQQVDIKLTSAGRKLLKHSKKIKLNIVGTFAPSKGAGAVAKGSVTLA
jgi:hypothetical protein